MNCREFRRVLKQAVESRQAPPREPLAEHAATCAKCATHWEAQQLLERAISDWREEHFEIDLADRVLADALFTGAVRHASDRVPRRALASAPPATARPGTPSASRRRVLAAAAATVVLALSAILVMRDRSGSLERVAVQPPQKSTSPAAEIQTAAAAPSAISETEHVEPSAMVRDAGSAYWTLASRTASALSDGLALVAPIDLAPARNEETQARPAEPPSWVDNLERDFAPLRNDFSRAIDTLLETVPADDVSTAL